MSGGGRRLQASRATETNQPSADDCGPQVRKSPTGVAGAGRCGVRGKRKPPSIRHSATHHRRVADWCRNSLTVVGAPEAIAAFAEKARVRPENVCDSWKRMRLAGSARPADGGGQAYVCGCCGEVLTFEQWFELHARKPFTLGAFVPEPAHRCAEERDAWRMVHWNTTRDAVYAGEGGGFMESYLTATPTRLEYRFATVIGPPLAAIKAMFEQHPDLCFTYTFDAAWAGEAGEIVHCASSTEAKIRRLSKDDQMDEDTF